MKYNGETLLKFWIGFFVFGLEAAWAETAPTGGANSLQQTIGPLLPIIIIFGIFYFMVIRPQVKKQKLHQQFLSELKKGDMVVTSSGIVGSIRSLSEKFVTLEIDNDVCVKIVRSFISESAGALKDKSEPAKA